MIQYISDLKRKWEEFNQYRAPTIDPVIIKEREHDMLYQFLSELDESYEQMRAQILFLAELPTLENAMARLQGEESWRELMGGTSVTQERPETLAMAVSKTHNPQQKGQKLKKCEHCRRDGHEKSKCWHLHPELRPAWWDEDRAKTPKGEHKGYAAQT
jgi:hypothetical protein